MNGAETAIGNCLEPLILIAVIVALGWLAERSLQRLLK